MSSFLVSAASIGFCIPHAGRVNTAIGIFDLREVGCYVDAARPAEGAVVTVTIYHNPSCGTSRNTLAMIRQSGVEPEVIEYLKQPPSRARLVELIKAMGISVRALLREKGTPYAELGLADPKWSDDELIEFMLAHPILINRPIVVTEKGVRQCRPSEQVLDLLDNPPASFVKEDGEVVARAKP